MTHIVEKPIANAMHARLTKLAHLAKRVILSPKATLGEERKEAGKQKAAATIGRLSEFRLPDGTPYTLDTTTDHPDMYRDGIAVHGGQDAEWRLCMKLLRPGETFLDLGANIGVFSIPAAKIGAHVHAFELLSDNARLLANAIEREQINNLQVVVGAVWNRTGVVDVDGFSAWGHVRPGGKTSIATVLIDDYVAQRSLTNVSVMKIDVEGGELAALGGARSIIARDHPDILIESNSITCGASGYSYKFLLQHLRDHGYTIYRIDDGALYVWPERAVQEIVLADYLATTKTADVLTFQTGVSVGLMSDTITLRNVLGQAHWGDHHWMHVLAIFANLPDQVRADIRLITLMEQWNHLRESAAMRQVVVGTR